MKKHDRSFRLLFAQDRLIEDLIRFIGHGESWVDDLDFSTLERVSTAHISDKLASRDGDVGWRVRLRNAPVAIYLLVEFQSTPDRFMALRESVYMGLFHPQILKQGGLTPNGLLPLVLSIVVYNGKARWLAPRELAELIHWIDGPLAAYVPRLWYEGGLRRAFVVWIRRVLLAGQGEGDIPELVNLEDFRTMLLESVEEWNREIEARGEEKGLEKGRRQLLLRQLEVKFGALDKQTRARVSAADSRRLMEWGERVLTAERLADLFRD